MKFPKKIRHPLTVFLHDLLMVPLAWGLAYWLRFNLDRIPSAFLESGIAALPVVVTIQGVVLWYSGLYRGVWRFASMPDLFRTAGAIGIGCIATAAALFFLNFLEGVPRSVFPLYGLLLLALLGGPRFIYRWFKDYRLYRCWGARTLIVGAGRAGEMLVRDMQRASTGQYHPVVFVDDDPTKADREIHNLHVVGACEAIPELVRQHGIELVLVAIPSATSRQLRRIVEICETTGVKFRTLPRQQELASDKASLSEVRQVQIEDLLARDKATLDWSLIGTHLNGKNIMVTGGGGSIGMELCRQIAGLKPAKLIVFEQNELNLYRCDKNLRRDFPGLSLVPVLGDICDPTALDKAFREHAPSVVFHAAAYKHVPLAEHQPRPVVLNNVFGTRNVAMKAIEHGCESFVLVSTDKAVNPNNTMGLTKRIAELLCQELNNAGRTRFMTVRFGNVLGSSGSVVRLFQEQIAAGGPVTVTHPDVTRYFMTISEACQLILQAHAIGEGGETFVLDMGEPVRIAYLAEQLIYLSGLKPGMDVGITYTGLRPGEKLHEELAYDSERIIATSHPKIRAVAGYAVTAGMLSPKLDELELACRAGDTEHLLGLLARFDLDSFGDPDRQFPSDTTVRARGIPH
ncbi:MAG: polysaccharide biosynthesis protein [Gammaproteobacteria bacterium]|nr:MAG: polysaccharide biosynthesis protein [Gammaproteobacteria bacterium]